MRHPTRTGIVILLVSLSVMTYIDRIIITIAGPGIMKEFSISETHMGSVYSAYLLSYSILMIPGGFFADVFGPRLALAAMAFGSALFTGLTAFAGSPGLGTYIGIVPSFLVMRLGMGICAAPEYPSSGKMNANWNPPAARARVWGWIAAGAGIGGACTPLLFSWMNAHYGWRGAFFAAALGSALLGGIWYGYVRDYPAEEKPSASGRKRRTTPWKALLTNRDLMLLTAGYFTVNYFEYIFFFWLYYYFGQIRKMGMEQSAIYTTLMWIAWIVMTPIGGWLSDRLMKAFGVRRGRRIVPVAGLALSALLVFIGTNVTDTLPTVVLLCLSLGVAASSDGPYWAAAIDASGEHSGTGSAIFNTGGNLGGMLAPVVTPAIARVAGWSWGLYAGGLLVLLGTAVWFFVRGEEAVETLPELAANEAD
ncbi:MAG TPA: MFS transporter [Bryobacteraceae bacterium]|nr:MFS transporter [Bryobacteraceae bacterium]